MEYLPVQEFSNRWNISKRRIQILCKEGRIEGAKKIGNMWTIPESAKRPYDARVKNSTIETGRKYSGIRKDLKKLLKKLYARMEDHSGISSEEKKIFILAAIASGLCCCYLDKENGDYSVCKTIYKDISGKDISLTVNRALFDVVAEFIDIHKDDPDLNDILSWSYQYFNKIAKDNQFSQTQFFTEKYMIIYLIENIHRIHSADKITDPCCGGGNFLVECLEFMSKSMAYDNFEEGIINIAEKLYGYDIDHLMTNIALVNIRLRAMAILKRLNGHVEFDLWDRIRPNIFCSEETDRVEGSLAIDNKPAVHVITGERVGLNDALGNSDVILTNPPFATIKGMSEEQKIFLKKSYPGTNCDTCVSFLVAIYKMLKPNGIFGIVSQNAWMHLKTFQTIREKITQAYTIYSIVKLGSGAFLDLSGEKSNVSLIIAGREQRNQNVIRILDLSACSLQEKIKSLQGHSEYIQILQNEIDSPNGYDFTGKGFLKTVHSDMQLYKDIAVPMQGTSTGNARELVGYFWEHFGEEEWLNVSNGGGYCRWQGLNDSVVKWGRSGEYIKSQKGSALRNVKYFADTQMVFSDTGTAGLNVRVLLDNQIFIASGPGIRVTKGSSYAHLALLNSRLAAYYVRIMSPKLTIAAGYIGQIPVNESIYSSVVLEKNARLCVELKQKILSTRPHNLEYEPSFLEHLPHDLEQAAWSLFNEDITNELLKLEIEGKIDRYVFEAYGFTGEEEQQFEKYVGRCAYLIDGAKDVDLAQLDVYMSKILDASCSLKRTRVSGNSLGSDGVIEYVSKAFGINPEIIVKRIQDNPFAMKRVIKKYKEMIIHNAILNHLGYDTDSGVSIKRSSANAITEYLTGRFGRIMEFKSWLVDSFNDIHSEIFKGVPYLVYQDGAVCTYDNGIER